MLTQPLSSGKRISAFLYRNSLTLTFLLLFFITILAQAFAGWKENNETLTDKGSHALTFAAYLKSGHFISTTFENWESEFLQMALFIILSIFLRQQGSAESKSMEGGDEVDREPKPVPGAPWPVRKGGVYLAVYKHSLSIVFLLLFVLSFAAHLYGSWTDYNDEQLLDHKSTATLMGYLGLPKFWFESFQNWRSEFLSIAAIIYLTIYLRQKGSAQSKPGRYAAPGNGLRGIRKKSFFYLA